EHDAVAADVILKAEDEKGTPAIELYKTWDKNYKDKDKEVETLKKSIRSIVAGQDERLNWLKLSKYVNDCLPRPDGKNLTDKQRVAFWEKGQLAFNKLVARNAAGKVEVQPGGDDGREDLILINLEAVNALFTEDLTSYFGRLKEANKELDAMP